MGYLQIIIIIVVILLSYFLVIRFVEKKLLIYSIVIITLFWMGLGGIGYNYLNNQQFRFFIDLKFRQVSEHKDLTSNASIPFPLPPKTVLAYRCSEKKAIYYTTQSDNEIITFFKSIVSKDNYSEDYDVNNNERKLKLVYNNNIYTVIIDKCIDLEGYYLNVYSK